MPNKHVPVFIAKYFFKDKSQGNVTIITIHCTHLLAYMDRLYLIQDLPLYLAIFIVAILLGHSICICIVYPICILLLKLYISTKAIGIIYIVTKGEVFIVYIFIVENLLLFPQHSQNRIHFRVKCILYTKNTDIRYPILPFWCCCWKKGKYTEPYTLQNKYKFVQWELMSFAMYTYIKTRYTPKYNK